MRDRILRWIYQSTLIREVYTLYLILWMLFTSRLELGSNIYDRDWDVVIILDACRVDVINEISDEYEFITEIESVLSVGSTSKEWMGKTFTKMYSNEIKQTTYVCSNPYMDALHNDRIDFLDDAVTADARLANVKLINKLINNDLVVLDQFAGYRSLFTTLSQKNRYSTADPRDVTDHAIDSIRGSPSGRHIIHYMQPHAPYIAEATSRSRSLYEYEENPFKALRSGTSRTTVWESYKDNLRYVLDSVQLLLNSVDVEKVVITSDHGELFGEFGLYGHGVGIPHPDVKRVPWIEVSASNTSGYQPDISKDEMKKNTEAGVRENLENLGYL